MPRDVDEISEISAACKEQLDIFLDQLKSCDVGWETIHALFKRYVKTAFRGSSFSDLYAYFREDGEETETAVRKDEQDELYAEAAQECWNLFFSPSPKRKCRVLNDALQDMHAGACTLNDALERVCGAVVDHLQSRVKDYVRDDDYRGLRQCIGKRKSLFFTKNHKNGKRSYLYFSLEETEDILQPRSNEEMNAFSRNLQAPDRPVRKTNAARDWNCKDVVVEEARRFWNAYVEAFHKGKPAYAPVFDMYRWLCAHLDMRKPVKVGLAPEDPSEEGRGGTVSEDRIAADPSGKGADVFEAVSADELRRLAKDFACKAGNDKAMAEVLVRKYAGEKHEDIVRTMGWKSVANVNRQFEKFRRCVDEFAAQHEELLEFDSKMTFCRFVIMEWKKMIPGSDKGE